MQNLESKFTVRSATKTYVLKTLLGEGTYGRVFETTVQNTEEKVVIKILKNGTEDSNEVDILEALRVFDLDQKNLVKYIERFTDEGQTCLAFEYLDKTLYQLLCGENRKPFSLNEIRPITQQLLTAFSALQSIGIVHADLKIDNVMLVDHRKKPFKTKLIDFGMAFYKSEAALIQGETIQALSVRAPEVILGIPFTEAIDIWSLGSLLVQLYTGRLLFPLNEYETIRNMVGVFGQPPDHLLDAGIHTDTFFTRSEYCSTKWRLKTPMEYTRQTGIPVEGRKVLIHFLDELMTFPTETECQVLQEDRAAFVDLLRNLLQTNPEKRITPMKALEHTFITMAHLKSHKDTEYVKDSIEKMQVCHRNATPEKTNTKNAVRRTTERRTTERRATERRAPNPTPRGSKKIADAPKVTPKKKLLRRICSFFSNVWRGVVKKRARISPVLR